MLNTDYIFSDGSKNKKDAIVCFVVTNNINTKKNLRIIKSRFKNIDNSLSVLGVEYEGILFAIDNNPFPCNIITDSQIIFKEINGLKQPDKQTIDFYNKTKELIEKHHIKLHWTSREDNVAGWILERRLRKIKKFKKLPNINKMKKINNSSKIWGNV